jgi:alpha-glucosidase (family GH31 glycosyl hydrolase)
LDFALPRGAVDSFAFARGWVGRITWPQSLAPCADALLVIEMHRIRSAFFLLCLLISTVTFAQIANSRSRQAGPVTFNGNPKLPPKWVFGVLFGSYHDQAGVMNDVAQLRADYSGDLYWIDSSWLSASYTGQPQNYICFQFDPLQFIDPSVMVAAIRQNNFNFGVWEWPWMDQGCTYFDYGVSNGLFVMNSQGQVVNAGGWHGNKFTGAFDYTNPNTVSWWESLNQPLVDMGLSFFKLDTGGGYPAGGVLYDGDDNQGHYRGLYHSTAWNMSATANGGRGFILAHNVSSPNNDQTPGMWTGDSTASWPGLQAEMKIASHLDTSSTAAYWCGDTGGYNEDPTDELYIRWLEYTTFTPCQEFFGSKTTSKKTRFPWDYSTQAQQIFKSYTQLRYRLLPFRYSNAQIAYQQMPVEYPVRWIGSTQLVDGNGASEILIQPITAAGTTQVAVRLPKGSSWVDYWTGKVYKGGSSPVVAAPIDKEPVFVKAGSIIPMGPVMQWVDQLPATPLTLDIYPGGQTSYTLYEDDGVTDQYAAGAFSTTQYVSDNSSGEETLAIAAAVGSYSGELSSREYVLKINLQKVKPSSVTRDGTTETEYFSWADFQAAQEGWFYDAAAKVVWVKFTISTSTATKVALQ